MRLAPLSLVAALIAAPAFAAPEAYKLDPSHSQILFHYSHLGFSTTYGMFSGFDGTINFDAEAPAESSVEVAFPVSTMLTGWQARFDHFMSPDFLGASEDKTVTFKSTGIEVTGEKTGKITGDLTLNGVTKSVVIDATLNQAMEHPMEKKPWLGFNGETVIKRSDYNLGMFAPYVGDDVTIQISIEAVKAE
ncbi:YceI family protein [Gemmobacter serpentinus]|uniref:YceI family protein n=1 Tax=Gemmobacter serpentinus TaxID=2652247 RepID=UPI00124C2B4F|nr:YceI family protein [Gemmobacter serpentinus]